MDDAITACEFQASDGVEDWRVLGEGASAFFRTGSFAESARFVAAIGAIDGLEDHPPRVAAAVAAGGHIVRDDFAPKWWTLADAAGNEADVATVKDRE